LPCNADKNGETHPDNKLIFHFHALYHTIEDEVHQRR